MLLKEIQQHFWMASPGRKMRSWPELESGQPLKSLAGASLQRAWQTSTQSGVEDFGVPPAIVLDFIFLYINNKEVSFFPWKVHESSLTPKIFGPVPSLDCHSESLIISQDKFNNSWLLFYSMLTKSHLETGETSIKATEIQNIYHISDCNTFLHIFLMTLLALTHCQPRWTSLPLYRNVLIFREIPVLVIVINM